jgi:hypothetical protein
VLAQVVVSEAGGPSKATSKSGGSPVLLATIAALASPVTEGSAAAIATARSGTGGGGRRRGRGILSTLAVVLTAFDRKLYMCPGFLSCPLPVAASAPSLVESTSLSVSL